MKRLYKGFVRTRNKASLDSFKGKISEELRKIEEVSQFDEFAGVLADDVILIDVDEKEQFEILMKIVEEKQLLCRVYESTRGGHFLFKNNTVENCKTHTKLACGLEADIKLGSKSSYEVLKFDGKDRPIIYDIFDGEEYQEVPKFLTPVNSRVDFMNMEEGDGRNQTLFNYILTLQSNDFSIDEAKECIEIINDFVLPEPLPDEEIEKILRDESFQKPLFYNKNQFLFDKFARYIKSQNRLIRINGSIHMYKDGVYVPAHCNVESAMIRIIPTLTKRNRTEVVSYLELIVNDESVIPDARFIAFKNGVYDLETGEFSDFSPEKIITNMIPWNYNPSAYFARTDAFLNEISCGNTEIRALLEEVIGYCFYQRNHMRKFFILIGDRANGKSTYLHVIEHLLGKANVCALDLRELDHKFKTSLLAGKLANIGDDISGDFIPNPATLKKIVSGELLNAERKGQDPFDFTPYAKLLFSANDIPRIKDNTQAVLSRMMIIPFNADFSNDKDPLLREILKRRESMEYLILLGIEGLKRVLNHHKFTTPDCVVKQIEEYGVENDTVLLFCQDKVIEDFEYKITEDVYQDYRTYCYTCGYQPIEKQTFSKKVNKLFNLTTEPKTITERRGDRKSCRIYIKKDS